MFVFVASVCVTTSVSNVARSCGMHGLYFLLLLFFC